MKNGNSSFHPFARVHIRDALKKVIQADEKTAVSKLQRKGLSKITITELTPKEPIPRITSFWKPLSGLALPDPDSLPSVPEDLCLPVDSVKIVDLDTVTNLIA